MAAEFKDNIGFYAHIKDNPDGTKEAQTLYDHLLGTAKRAQKCLKKVNLGNISYLAGLMHDMGKYTHAFQEYLKSGDASKRGSVIHTFQGCRYILERFHSSDNIDEIAAAEIIAFAIAAHHGLFDCVAESLKIGFQYRVEKTGIDYEEAEKNFFQDPISRKEIESRFAAAVKEISMVMEKIEKEYSDDYEYCFQTGLLNRLILSSVIEGDRYDTASFMEGITDCDWPEDMVPLWTARLQYMEDRLKRFSEDTPINKARKKISSQCRKFAQEPSGIYRLNVPTGGGKTLSSLRYALAHAEKWNKKRIIFTSPLLSILEQNAEVIHDFVGDDGMILEHHSNMVQTVDQKEKLDKRELMVQSWNAPIIVTTMVQLLNALFEGKTTAIRRFQALCNSVIIIDEVQTVPPKMLTLFTLALRFLQEQCDATIVLCSATQPVLEKTDHPLKETPEEIIPYDEKIWNIFKRTEIEPAGNFQMKNMPEFVASVMEEAESLLVVCNKKGEAAYLMDESKEAGYPCFHLSASMCMQHRRDTVRALRESMDQKQKTLCISTQVIEAGVDISFERVIRLAAGMDSVIQAAGRCNRNGESETPCPVYIVNCTDENLSHLQDIQRGKTASLELLEDYQTNPEKYQKDLSSFEAIRYYYRSYYRDMEKGAQDYPVKGRPDTLFCLLSDPSYVQECEGAEQYFLRQAFAEAGKIFSVFNENTVDVLVPYKKGAELILQLGSQEAQQNPFLRKKLLSEAKSYTVSLYQHQLKHLEEKGAIAGICGNSVLTLMPEYYNEITGVQMEAGTLDFWEV